MENTQLWMNGLNQQKRPITQQPVPVQFGLSREEQLEAKRLAEEANFSFEGYQVVRREFISHRFDPAMTIRGNSITFNNSCISKLENASYIQFLINPTEQKMIIRPCDEGARDAIRWCILKADKRKSRQIWQYSDEGRVNGINGNVDMNYCYTNYPIIVKAEGYNGYRKAGIKKASAYKTTATGTSNTSAKKSVDELAKEVIAGKWAAGDERKQKLTEAGYDYSKVQARVNELMAKPKLKTVDEIAKEVIQGKWSAGDERKLKLTAAGYDYSKVQARVNELMKNQ